VSILQFKILLSHDKARADQRVARGQHVVRDAALSWPRRLLKWGNACRPIPRQSRKNFWKIINFV